MDLPSRRQVKKEIQRLAPTLAEGESGPVRIHREAHIALISESGPPHIHCLHQSSDLLRPLLDRIGGSFSWWTKAWSIRSLQIKGARRSTRR